MDSNSSVQRDLKPNKVTELRLLFIALLFAFIVRAIVVWIIKWNSPNGDEAVAGLMAKHIAEGRDYPIFFYGQSYFGALESYINALLFRIVGFTPNLIFILPIVFGVATVWIEYTLVRNYIGHEVALASMFVVALAPSELLYGSLSAAGGFGLALLLELITVLLFLKIYYADQVHLGPFLGFSLTSGLLFWVWQIYIPIFIVLLMLWMARRPRISVRLVYLGGILFFASSSPLWFYNITHGGETFTQVFGKYAAADANSGLIYFAKTFIGNRIWNLAAYAQSWLLSLSGGNLVLFVAFLIGIGLILRRFGLRLDCPGFRLSWPWLFLSIAAAAFVMGHRSPRYLYILPFLLIPPALGGWKQFSRWALMGTSIVIVATNVASITQMIVYVKPQTDWNVVIATLESNHLNFGYSDFWTAYPITFVSAEKIVVAPLILGPNAVDIYDRYPVYSSAVNRAPETFVLLPNTSSDRALIESRLNQEDGSINRLRLKGLDATLYWPLTLPSSTRRWLANRENP